MANTNSPFGFKPVSHLIGGPGNWTTKTYSIASGYAANIGMGDPVEQTGTADNVQLAAAGNVDNLGIFAGVEYTDANGRAQWSESWASGTTGTNIKAKVIVDPFVIYEVQADSAAANDIGAFADWVAGSVSSVNGRSGAYLEVSSTATSGKSMVVLGKVDRPDNAWGAYCKVYAMFREHNLLTGAASAGGV